MTDNHIPIEAWDEESFPVNPIQFDYEAIFSADEKGVVEDGAAFQNGRQVGRREALTLLIELLKWCDGDARGTVTGLRNRAACLEFLFNPDYADCTQAEILRRYGFDNKQLLNRELSHYRDRFDQKDPRFYSQAARAVYARRFEKQ